jgi:signal recognition particle subunit SRP72
VQLFLFLKASKYDEALKRTEKDPEQFKFERAYALYRLQRESEAEELLQQADQGDRAVALLHAQIVRISSHLCQ